MIQEPIVEKSRTSMTGEEKKHACCPVFGVESGGPIIGLGIVLILCGSIPFLVFPAGGMPVFVFAMFIGFGIFLIWAGLTK